MWRNAQVAEGVTPIEETGIAVVTVPQVVLKIRRRKFNQQQFHTGEIVVTRRLFRSGDSEYLLNGKLCRSEGYPGPVHGDGSGAGVLCAD